MLIFFALIAPNIMIKNVLMFIYQRLY